MKSDQTMRETCCAEYCIDFSENTTANYSIDKKNGHFSQPKGAF